MAGWAIIYLPISIVCGWVLMDSVFHNPAIRYSVISLAEVGISQLSSFICLSLMRRPVAEFTNVESQTLVLTLWRGQGTHFPT